MTTGYWRNVPAAQYGLQSLTQFTPTPFAPSGPHWLHWTPASRLLPSPQARMKSAGRTVRWEKQSTSTGRAVSAFTCVVDVAARGGGLAEAVVIAAVSRGPATRVT